MQSHGRRCVRNRRGTSHDDRSGRYKVHHAKHQPASCTSSSSLPLCEWQRRILQALKKVSLFFCFFHLPQFSNSTICGVSKLFSRALTNTAIHAGLRSASFRQRQRLTLWPIRNNERQNWYQPPLDTIHLKQQTIPILSMFNVNCETTH